MSKFIRISGHVINPKWISHISVEPTFISIKLAPPEVHGLWIVAGGGLSSSLRTFEIKKDTFPLDYDKIIKWMDENSE